MKEVVINNIEDIKVVGFNIEVKLPNGEVEIIKNGVTDLLKGELVFNSSQGSGGFSKTDILNSINFDVASSILIPELITSNKQSPNTDSDKESVKRFKEANAEVENLKDQLKELEKLKEKLEKEKEENEENQENQEEIAEAMAEATAEAAVLENILDKAMEALAAVASTQGVGEAIAHTGESEGSAEAAQVTPGIGKKKADSDPVSPGNPSAGSSGEKGVSDEVPEPEPDVFIEIQLSERSDSGELGDFLTNVNTPTFEGETTPGATVVIKVNDKEYTAVADSSGKYIIVIEDPLEDGEHLFEASATDAKGDTVTSTVSVVVDTVPPEIVVDLVSDTGADENDYITSSNKPVFNGVISGDPISVSIIVDGQVIVLPAVNGEFSYTYPEPLEDGEYKIIFKATDAAGNEAAQSIDLVIDTVNNFSVFISEADDSGVDGDWITNNPRPTFMLNHEPGSTVQVRFGSKTYDVILNDESPTSFTLDTDLPEGDHTIIFTSTDLAGNKVERSQNITIDYTPPQLTVIGMTDDTNSGSIDDTITSNTTPAFEGRCDVGSTVFLIVDGATYQTVVDDKGRWTVTIDAPLSDGDYDVVIYAVDIAGNQSDSITSQITIDTQGPIITGGLSSESDSGASSEDGITNSTTLKFSGTTEPLSTVYLVIESLNINLQIQATENGDYGFTLENVAEGTYEYRISAIDIAGNESSNVITKSVTVDLSITNFSVYVDDSDVREHNADEGSFNDLTNDNTPLFRGTAEPNAKIYIQYQQPDGNSITLPDPIMVGSDGNWSFQLPNSLTDGVYNFSFSVTDVAGNTESIAVPIEIDTVNTLTVSFDSETGSNSDDRVLSNDETPEFSGKTDPKSIVTITLTHPATGEKLTASTTADENGNWTLEFSSEQSLSEQGDWTWSVSSVDPAGNFAPGANGGFIFDTVLPIVDIEFVSDTGFNDSHTNDNTLDFVVTTESTATVEFKVFSVNPITGVVSATPVSGLPGPQLVPANGQLSYEIPQLADGEYAYQAIVTDQAGNTITTENKFVTIDTVLPLIGQVELTELSDSNIDGDNVTNNQDLVFEATGTEVGTRLTVTVKNTATGEFIDLEQDTIAINSPNWTYELPKTLLDGKYEISFVVTDSAGNNSIPSVTTVTIDTLPPVLGSVTLEEASDSGASTSDFITNVISPVFIGSTEKDAVVTIKIFDANSDALVKTVNTTVVNSDGTWSLQVPDLPEGEYRWEVISTDVAGNVTTLNENTQKLVIDTSYVGQTGELTDESDTGNQQDNITKLQEVSLGGKGEVGSDVRLVKLVGPDGVDINVSGVSAVQVDSEGNWTLKLPALASGDGTYSWKVELTDIAGNVGEVTGELTLDTQTFVEATLTAESDTGSSSEDGISKDQTPTFSGKGEVGGIITLLLKDAEGKTIPGIESVIVDANGNWQITAPELTDGVYTWSVSITDIAGVVLSTSEKTYIVDTTLPVVMEADLVTENVIGFESEPQAVNTRTPSFAGTISESGGSAVLHFYRVTDGVANESPVYSSSGVSVNADGEFSITVGTQLPDGEYRWAIEATDAAGNTTTSAKQSIIIDLTPPTVTEAGLSEDSDTSLVPGSNYTNQDAPTLAGKGEPGSRITIEIAKSDGTIVNLSPTEAYVTVSANGSWEYVLPSSLADGSYTWTATSIDAAGNRFQTEPIILNVDTLPPPLSDVELADDSDSGLSVNDGITNADTMSFTGKSEQGNKVVLRFYALDDPNTVLFEFEQMIINSDGTWSIDATEIPEGSYNWSVTAIDKAGNTLIFDAPQDLVVDRTVTDFTAGLSDGSDLGSSQTDDLTSATNLQISGTGEVGGKVSLVSLKNATTQETITIPANTEFTVGVDGIWSLDLPDISLDGTYEWVVKFVDVAGNEMEITDSIVIDRSINLEATFDSQTGVDDTGLVQSNIAEPSFSGTGDPKDKITVVITGPEGNVTLETVVDSDGNWSISGEALPVDGWYSWVVKSEDAAGNTITQEGDFLLDAHPPVVITQLVTDSGFSSDDNLTNDDNLSITVNTTGKATSVQLVIFTGDNPTLNHVFNQTHTFNPQSENNSFTFINEDLNLADGTYKYVVYAMDAAGNKGQSTVEQITIDTTAPDVPVVNQGDINQLGYTNDPELNFSGTAEANSRVFFSLYAEDGTAIDIAPAYAEVNSSGGWSYSISKEVADQLADGSYRWEMRVMDAAGNISAATENSFVLDTIASTIEFTGLSSATDTGESQADFETKDNTPTFTGTTSEDVRITITLTPVSGNGDAIVLNTDVVTGNWELVVTKPLLDGEYQINISAEDKAGNISPTIVSDSNLVIDTVLSGGDDFGLSDDSDTGSLDNDELTNSDNIKLYGQVEPGATVVISELRGPNDVPIDISGILASAIADNNGEWTISIPPSLIQTDGTYDYKLSYTDPAGNTKEVSGSFVYDSVIEITGGFGSQTGQADDVIYNNSDQFVFNGTGTKGDIITVTITGKLGYLESYTTTVNAAGEWQISEDAPDIEGEFTWVISATDAAGNIHPPIEGVFIRDTTPPGMPIAGLTDSSDTGYESDDGITKETNPVLSVTGDVGSKVTIKIWDDSVSSSTERWSVTDIYIDESGTIEVPVTSALMEGSYTWIVTLTDVAGNSISSDPLKLVIDTTLPVIENFQLHTDSETGQSDTDNVTNDTTPTFTGTGQVGARVSLEVVDSNGVNLNITPAYVTVDLEGNWSFTPDSGLPDGIYTVRGTIEDLAGNVSQSGTITITIDTVAPILTDVVLSDVSDTGNKGDDTTKNKSPTFSGSSEKDAEIKIILFKNGEPLLEQVVVVSSDEGTWELTLDNELADGDYTWEISATDVAGNQSPSTVGNLTVDTVIDAFTVKIEETDDTGLEQADGITSQKNITLTGTGEVGAKVTIVSLTGPNNEVINPNTVATVDANGNWSFDLPALDNGDGNYVYVIRLTDIAGNTQEITNTIQLDTTNPTLTSGLDSDSDSGAEGDFITNDNTPTYTGTVNEPTKIVMQVWQGSSKLHEYGPIDATSGNEWSVTATDVLPDGTYSIKIISTDIAGNETIDTHSITIDTTAPEISEVRLVDTSDTGYQPDDGITKDNTPTFYVAGEVGSTITIQLWTEPRGANEFWTVTDLVIPAGGFLEIPITSTLNDGDYSWSVTLTDVAGNTTTSDLQNLIVDTSAPLIDNFQLDSDSESGQNLSDNIINDSTPTFTGTGEIGARISLTILNSSNAQITVNPAYVTVGKDGNWSFTLANALPDGVYTVKSTIEDAAGNTAQSETISITIDTVAPILNNVGITDESNTGTKDDNVTYDKSPTFSGTSEKDAKIKLVLTKDGVQILEHVVIVTDNNGSWTLTVPDELADGDYIWSIVATDVAGNQSPESTGSLIVDTVIDAFTATIESADDTGDSQTDGLTNQKNITLTGTGEVGAKVTIVSLTGPDNITVNPDNFATVAPNGTWSLQLPILNSGDGSYTYVIRLTDVAGNTQNITGAIDLDTTSPTLSSVLEDASNSGSTDDLITNDTTLSFLGTVSEPSKLTLAVLQGDTVVDEYGPVDVEANEQWRVTASNALADGVYTVNIIVVDAAGNESINSHVVTIDTTQPIVNAELSSASDSGALSSDGITNATTVSITGNVEGEASNVTYQYSIAYADGNFIKVGDDLVGNAFNESFNLDQGDGQYRIKVVATDLAGNSNEKVVTIQLDTSLQDFSTATGIDSESDTGSLNSDSISNDKAPSFTGKTEGNATVTASISLNGTEVFLNEVVAGADGMFTVNLPANTLVTDGVYTWRLTAEDLAGNVRTKTGSYTLDTTAPEISYTLLNDTGNEEFDGIDHDGDFVTQTRTVNLSGSSNENSLPVTVTLSNSSGIVLDTQTVNVSNGSWIYNYNTALADGQYTIHVSSTDVAGNEFSHTQTLVIDNSILNEVQFDSDSGVEGDFITNAQNLEFSGKTDPNAQVTIAFENQHGQIEYLYSDAVLGSANSGDWSFTIPDLIPNGIYTIVVSVLDAAGNSSTNRDMQITVDRTAPPIMDLQIADEDDTGIKGDWRTEQSSFTVIGKTDPGSVIRVTNPNNGEFIDAVVDAEGNFTVEFTNLVNGYYEFSFVATDVAGNQTTVRQAINVGPADVDFTVELDKSSDVGVIGDDTTSITNPSFSGTGTPGYIVRLMIGSETYSTTVDGLGKWLLELPDSVVLPDGENTLTFQIYDAAGNTKLDELDYTVNIDASYENFTAELADSTENNDILYVSSSTPLFTGVGEVGARVIISIVGSDTEYTALVNEFGIWQLEYPSLLNEGSHSMEIFSIDAAGNRSDTITIDFTVDLSPPELTYEIEGVYESDSVLYLNGDQDQLIFKGTVNEPGGIRVTINQVTYTDVVITEGGGEWKIIIDAELADMPYFFEVEFFDRAGNSISQTGNLIIDKTISAYVYLDYGSDSYAPGDPNDNDGVTNKNENLSFSFSRNAYKTDSGTIASVSVTGANLAEPEVFTGIDTSQGWVYNAQLADGSYSFAFSFIDPAGNTATRTVSVVVDTVIPDLIPGEILLNDSPLVEGEALFTNKDTLSLSFKPSAEGEYSQLVVRINNANYKAVKMSDGSFKVFGIPVLEGTNTLSIKAYDAAGNVTEIVQTVEVDSEFGLLELNINNQSVENLDYIEDVYTNLDAATMPISGTIDQGGSFKVSLNGQIIQDKTEVNEDGSWSYDITGLQEGVNKITIIFEDQAGNTKSVNFNIELDTLDPLIVINNISGDGYDEIDGENYITSDTVQISGVLDTGSEISSVTINGVSVEISDNKGSFSFTVDSLVEGSNTIIITAIDKAGNTTEEIISIIRDTAVTGFSANLAVADGEGVEFSAEFSGQVEQESAVSVSITNVDTNEIQTYQAQVDANGNWSLSLPDLTSGEYTWSATATDKAGNIDTISSSGTVSIDKDTSVNPLTAEIDVTQGDGVEFSAAFNGTVEIGSQVTVTFIDKSDPSNTITYNGKVDAQGNWTLNVTDLASGEYEWIVTGTDSLGNTTSTPAQDVTIARDTEVTTLTASVDVVDASGGELGSASFSGTVEVGSTVEIIITNIDTGVTTSYPALVSGGNWTVDVPNISGGDYTWVTKATDAVGNHLSSEPESIHITEDTLVTGFTADASFSSAQEPTDILFNGHVEPGSSIVVSLTTLVGDTETVTTHTATVDPSGSWSINVQDLPYGSYSWSVKATDPAGNIAIKESSSSTVIAQDTEVSTFEANSEVLNSTEPGILLFSGTVELGSSVKIVLTNNATDPATITEHNATVGSDGVWTVVINDLPDGNFSWTASATDPYGNSQDIVSTEDLDIIVEPTLNEASGVESSSVLDPVDMGSVVEIESGDSALTIPPLSLNTEILPTENTTSSEDVAPLQGSKPSLIEEAEGQNILNDSLSDAPKLSNDNTLAKEDSLLQENNSAAEALDSKVFTGESQPETNVTLEINNQKLTTTSDEDGDWFIKTDLTQGQTYEYSVTYTDMNDTQKTETGSVTVEVSTMNKAEFADSNEESLSNDNSSSADYAPAPEAPAYNPVNDIGYNDMDKDSY